MQDWMSHYYWLTAASGIAAGGVTVCQCVFLICLGVTKYSTL